MFQKIFYTNQDDNGKDIYVLISKSAIGIV